MKRNADYISEKCFQNKIGYASGTIFLLTSFLLLRSVFIKQRALPLSLARRGSSPWLLPPPAEGGRYFLQTGNTPRGGLRGGAIFS